MKVQIETKALTAAALFAATSKTSGYRQYLENVLIEFREDHAVIVGTDGAAICIARATVMRSDDLCYFPSTLQIPASALSKLKNETTTLEYTSDEVLFVNGQRTSFVRGPDDWPRWRACVEDKDSYKDTLPQQVIDSSKLSKVQQLAKMYKIKMLPVISSNRAVYVRDDYLGLFVKIMQMDLNYISITPPEWMN